MGPDLQTTEIFLLNDLGIELCMEKIRKRERDTPQRGGRRLNGAILAHMPKTHRDRERDTNRDQNRSSKRQKTKQNQCKLEENLKPNIIGKLVYPISHQSISFTRNKLEENSTTSQLFIFWVLF